MRRGSPAGCILRVLAAGVASLWLVPAAQALEAFDGRLQVHGFYEAQLRFLNADFAEDWDFAQWYNVLNVELELDILQDPIGPIDLLSGYVRLETRYDCVYTEGCGIFGGQVNTYGDDTKSLPRRLNNAVDLTYAGAIPIPRTTASVNGDLLTSTLNGERRSGATTDPQPLRGTAGFSILATQNGADGFLNGNNPGVCGDAAAGEAGPCETIAEFPGAGLRDDAPEFLRVDSMGNDVFNGARMLRVSPSGILGRNAGADGMLGTADDPRTILSGNQPLLPVFADVPDADTRSCGTVDPQICRTLVSVRVDGFRRELTPEQFEMVDQALLDAIVDNAGRQQVEVDAESGLAPDPNGPQHIAFLPPDDPFAYVFENFDEFRFAQINGRGGADDGLPTLVLGPWLPKNFVNPNGQLADRVNPFDNSDASPVLKAAGFYTVLNGDGTEASGADLEAAYGVFERGSGTAGALSGNSDPLSYNRIRGGGAKPFRPIPLVSADGQGPVALRATLDLDGDGVPDTPLGTPNDNGNNVLDGYGFPIETTGPFGEVAFVTAREQVPVGPADARGIYLPSRPLQLELESGRLDTFNFNFREAERAWNYGDSQQDEHELKEAYLDAEFLDSRLWLRLGKQQIVWGKTEIFRTTDQFNPQDLALASLPSLEESRIALWAARGVYSFYEVGPLSDVRVELAFNYDQVEPADLGACGEAFTPNVVCQLTFGAFAHGVTGVGIAGVDRPRDPWHGFEGWEVGGRVEFRWDRFSFALIDFWGYSDFPTVDQITHYERNVDPRSGLPRVHGDLGPCTTGLEPSCLKPGPTDLRAAYVATNTLRPQNTSSAPPLSIFRPSPLGRNTHVNLEFCYVGFFFDTQTPGVTQPGCYKVERDPVTDAVAPDGQGDPVPILSTDGSPTGVRNRDLAEFYPERNSLQFHHANQTIFAMICSTTVGFNSIDPTACAQTIFGSTTLIGGARVANVLGAAFAGSAAASGVAAGNVGAEKTPLPLVRLSRDPRDVTPVFAGADPDADERTFHMPSLAGPDGTFGTADDVLLDANGPSAILDDRTGVEIADCIARIDFNNQLVEERCSGPGADQSFVSVDGPAALADPLGLALDPDKATLGGQLTPEQEALLGCGPFWGTNCDDQGVDLLNMEASMILQSFIGFEGTFSLAENLVSPDVAGVDCSPETNPDVANDPNCNPTQWQTNNPFLRQPGTVGFYGGPVCTIGHLARNDSSLRGDDILPGCRSRYVLDPVQGTVVENLGGARYLNGRLVRDSSAPRNAWNVFIDGNPGGPLTDRDLDTLEQTRRDAFGFRVVSRPDLRRLVDGDDTAFSDEVVSSGVGNNFDLTPFGINPAFRIADGLSAQRRLAFAEQLPDASSGLYSAVLGSEFGALSGGSFQARHPFVNQVFANETAVLSFNFLMLIAAISEEWDEQVEEFLDLNPALDLDTTGPCDPPFDILTDENGNPVDCTPANKDKIASLFFQFQAADPDATDDPNPDSPEAKINADATLPADAPRINPLSAQTRRTLCSYVTPQFCGNVQSIFAVAGTQRNIVRAGGNRTFGRRTFQWHSGGEGVLRYEKRNVLGFSMDFAEDRTKTNWGVEFTWIPDVSAPNNDRYDGLSQIDAYNLTIAMDRPTFVNFLNPNRTFFITTQWFFQYLDGFDHGGNTINGPWNVLGLLVINSGYFQDRLLPSITGVYDVRSRSGALLGQVQYRFNEAFSATVGANLFWGRTELVDIPEAGLAPAANQQGPNAYRAGVDNVLAVVRDRDEVFLRLRYTF